MISMICGPAFLYLLIAAGPLSAHHNPIAYDGKKEVKISGKVTSAYYGFPHSRYEIDVTNDSGEVETRLLLTEDPGGRPQPWLR